MKLTLFLLAIIIILGSARPVIAQTDIIDSLDSALASIPAGDPGRDAVCKHLASALHQRALELARQQQRDSARTMFLRSLSLYKMLNDSLGIDEDYDGLAGLLVGMGLMDSARALLQRCVEIRIAIGRPDMAAVSLASIGQLFSLQGNYAKAIESMSRSLDLWRSIDDQRGVAIMQCNIAGLQTVLGQTKSALMQLKEALHIMEKLQIPRGQALASLNIGNVYFKIASTDDSENGDYRRIMYDSAAVYYARALPLYEQIGARIDMSKALNNLGSCHFEQHHLREAEEYWSKALKIRQEEKSIPDMISILLNLGSLHKELLEYDTARVYNERALKIATELGASGQVRQAELQLSELAVAQEDFQSAYRHQYRLNQLEDSLWSEENTRQINKLRAEYDYETQKRQIELREKGNKILKLELDRKQAEILQHSLEQEQAAQRLYIQALKYDSSKQALSREHLQRLRVQEEAERLRQNDALRAAKLSEKNLLVYALIIGVFLLLVIGALLQRRARTRRLNETLRAEAAELHAQAATAESHRLAAENERREKEAQRNFARGLIRAQEAERSRIANDLHDSLGQELVIIKHRALLAVRALANRDKLRAQLDQVAERAGHVLQSMREISHNLRPLEMDRVGFTETVRGLLYDIQEITAFQLHSEVESLDSVFGKEEEITLYRVIQEALGNIVKHADASEATFLMTRDDGTVRLEIRDNGKGFHVGDVLHPGGNGETAFGLHGMTERVQMLGGTFEIASAPGRGTAITIILPVEREHPFTGPAAEDDSERTVPLEER